MTKPQPSKSELELAALMCSRLCHDLIGPVGAITNGLEFLEDDDDPDMRAHALSLIGNSAASASAKLQFMRLAFGSASTMGDEIDPGALRTLTENMVAGSRISLAWHSNGFMLAKLDAKLLLNLVLVGMECLPRGGVLSVRLESPACYRIEAEGQRAKMTSEGAEYLQAFGAVPDSPRAVVPFLAGLLARDLGRRFTINEGADRVVVSVS